LSLDYITAKLQVLIHPCEAYVDVGEI